MAQVQMISQYPSMSRTKNSFLVVKFPLPLYLLNSRDPRYKHRVSTIDLEFESLDISRLVHIHIEVCKITYSESYKIVAIL